MLEYIFKQSDYDAETKKRIARGRRGIDSPSDRKPLNVFDRPMMTEERLQWADPKMDKKKKRAEEDRGVNAFAKILKGLEGQ